MFFKKLVLFEDELKEVKHVRHYDLECEAVNSIMSIIIKKGQYYKLKAFDQIKKRSKNIHSTETHRNNLPFAYSDKLR